MELQDNLDELNKLFGKPKDGSTECFVQGNIMNRIMKEDVDSGYWIGGTFNSKIINPKGKVIARISSECPKKILVGEKDTGYFFQGAFNHKIMYSRN